MQASVCVGNYAKTPYCIAGLEQEVYSMEELCYCLKENAFLLDVSIMNDDILKWIEKECGLKELSDALYPLVHKQGALSAFVVMILDYTGFYNLSAVNEVEQTLKRGAGLSQIEKRKTRIDYLAKKKRYVAALLGYDDLLSQWQQTGAPNPEVRADILYNKGVVLAGMMLYGQAAQAFWEAWQQAGRTDDFKAYLAAKRMELSEGDYIVLIAELANSYEYSLALEKELEELQQAWKESLAYRRLQERSEWRGGSDMQKYYNENERITQVLKESYRVSVTE